MKNVLFVLVLCLSGLAMYLWLRPCPVPQGKVVVTKGWLDSLNAIANQPPETLRIETPSPPDTVEKPIYVPVPAPVDSNRLAYHDSLVTPQFSMHVLDTIQKGTGLIISRKWRWRLFVPEKIETVITKPFPMPYPVEKPVKEWQYFGKVWIGNGLQLEGGAIYKGRWIVGTKAGLHSVEIGGGVVF